MINDKDKNDEEDDFEMPKLDIRQENEFKKIKMNLESGAIFPDDLSKNLPPELESQFLDSIMNFEKALRNAKKISVFDKIGRPDYIAEKGLNDTEIVEELEKIKLLLQNNGMNLDVLADYDDEERLIYKFITEELFLLEVDDLDLPGISMCFTYEEFHQNHKYDIQRETDNFLNMILNKKSNFYDKFHSKDLKNHVEINSLRSLFKKFKIKSVDNINIIHNDEKARSTFDIEFWGKMEGNNNKIHYSGEGSMTFEYKSGYWFVTEVNLPING
ncbi:MAG: hypothetical protein H7174_03875 [Flavobacterium sp.]|nr:hypothetical protein [Flavobacterium sp.]